jgi:hypothetical protein
MTTKRDYPTGSSHSVCDICGKPRVPHGASHEQCSEKRKALHAGESRARPKHVDARVKRNYTAGKLPPFMNQ